MSGNLGKFFTIFAFGVLTFWFCHVIGLSIGWMFLVTLILITSLTINFVPNLFKAVTLMLGIWAAAIFFVHAPSALEAQRQAASAFDKFKPNDAISSTHAMAAAMLPAASSSITPIQPTQNGSLATQAQTTVEAIKALEKLCSAKTLTEEACTQARAKLLQ